MNNVENKKIGIILSGGGAKGAYQIGALRAIEEFGLLELCKYYSGTSVGALNAIIFPRGYKYCKSIWDSIDEDSVLTRNSDTEKLVREMGIVKTPFGVLQDEINFFLLHKIFIEINNKKFKQDKKNTDDKLLLEAEEYFYEELKGGMLSRKSLVNILNKIDIDIKKIPNDIKYYITTCKQKRTKTQLDISYHEVTFENDISTNEIMTLLLASSAIPYVFPPVEFRGEMYVDGGLKGYHCNNFPSTPLNWKCDIKIGIDVTRDQQGKVYQYYEDCIYITPSDSRILYDTLNFDNDKYEYMINLGYYDSYNVLSHSEIALDALYLKNIKEGVIILLLFHSERAFSTQLIEPRVFVKMSYILTNRASTIMCIGLCIS